MLWIILTKCLFRTTFGIALAMLATPANVVSSGFYRVHLWVMMGANTLIALTLFSQRDSISGTSQGITLATAIALFSYLGAVAWLYEHRRFGYVLLATVMVLALVASLIADFSIGNTTVTNFWIASLDTMSAGFLLGSTLTAMFLGHWYLNSPGMRLQPLQRLEMFMFIAVLLRVVVCGTGLWEEGCFSFVSQDRILCLLALRWLAGLVGVALIAVMTWITLRIPNTQSATGILYVGVIFVLLGELTSQFLTLGSAFPL